MELLTAKIFGGEVGTLLKAGFLCLEDGEVKLSGKGTRILLTVLFEANKAELLKVATDQLAKKAKKKVEDLQDGEEEVA